MPTPSGPSVTVLLERARAGDRDALAALLPLVYDELRRIARMQMRRERPGQTIDATGLVHEAWLRLSASSHLAPHNRAHFLGIAANAMRQILVERARARHAAKRGGHRERVTLTEASTCSTSTSRSTSSPPSTPIRRGWSNCATSAASPSRKRPKRCTSRRRR
jgi:RNA polymerase sigma factor (TIGR02999 family)